MRRLLLTRTERMKLEKMKFLLATQNMDRALQFYLKVFALRKGRTSAEWSELFFGDSILALHRGGEGAAKPASISFQVNDAEEACRAVVAAGGEVIQPPEARPGESILSGTFRDTEGNVVMMTQWVG